MKIKVRITSPLEWVVEFDAGTTDAAIEDEMNSVIAERLTWEGSRPAAPMCTRPKEGETR